MKTDIFDSAWCDVVFINRNRSYGAFMLRRLSERNAMLAILFSVLFTTGIAAFPLLLMHAVVPHEVPFDDGGTTIDPPPVIDEIKPIHPIDPPPPSRGGTTLTTPVLSTDSMNDDPDPLPGDKGDGKETTTETPITESSGKGKVVDLPPVEPPITEISRYAQEMPEFPGGSDKLPSYISGLLHYPRPALKEQVSGVVYIEFVIDEEGLTKDVKVVKGIGYGCDEEAMRVIKGMPRWKQGRQNGRAVKVKFTLPVHFTIRN